MYMLITCRYIFQITTEYFIYIIHAIYEYDALKYPAFKLGPECRWFRMSVAECQ